MSRKLLTLLLLGLMISLPLRALAEDDEEGEENPHLMVAEDGTKIMDKCGYCHNEDNKTLERSPLETCTSCHNEPLHGGSLWHVKVKPEDVKRVVPPNKPGEMPFPLTGEGAIYCATCHLPHDPGGVVDGHKWLPAGCPESTTPFAVGVKEAVDKYRDSIGDEKAAHFVKEGTRALRLSACDGQLCLHCHGDKR